MLQHTLIARKPTRQLTLPTKIKT